MHELGQLGVRPAAVVNLRYVFFIQVILIHAHSTGHSFLLIALILCEDQLFLSRGHLLRLCACGQHLTAEPEQTLCFLIFLSHALGRESELRVVTDLLQTLFSLLPPDLLLLQSVHQVPFFLLLHKLSDPVGLSGGLWGAWAPLAGGWETQGWGQPIV